MQTIIEANHLSPPYRIEPRQVLKVPEGVPYYVVRPGDTLYGIGERYNVTLGGYPMPQYIQNANQGMTPFLVPGMKLKIPYRPLEVMGGV